MWVFNTPGVLNTVYFFGDDVGEDGGREDMMEGKILLEAFADEGGGNVGDDLGGGFEEGHVGVGDIVALAAPGIDVKG